MKKDTLVTLISFGFAFLCLFLCLSLSDGDNLYDSVIRIHVLANSDEKEDQETKLAVRDSILLYAKENLPQGKNREEAKEIILENISEIERVAEETLRKEGREEKVSVELSEEYYGTRHYDSFSLPAGSYLSLKVKIGSAQGQNWWCVLFPPICLSSATSTESALMGAGMSRENVNTVTGKDGGYQIRFKILEVTQETKRRLSQLF